jgi:hypothetical protein
VPAGKLGIVAPGPTSKLAMGVGHTAAPVGVHDVTVQLLKPVPGLSNTTEPVPLAGPELVKVTVYTVVPPATVVVMPSVLETPRLMAGFTVLVTVFRLLAGVGFVTKLDIVAWPTLVSVPENVLLKVAVIVYRTVPPIDSDTVLLMLPVPLVTPQAVVCNVGVPAVCTEHAQVAVLIPGDKVSVTVMDRTMAGPGLLTFRTYTTV